MNYYEKDMQYYPTPESLLDEICKDMNWNKINTILEPSAGKGDIADYVKKALNTPYKRYEWQIDCIEKDGDLRKLLEGKQYHVVHDDFLSYHGRFHYDLIIMNPPFKEGDKHLLKALEIQKYGGSILCILNAETIDNPYTNLRKTLVQQLNELNASISYYDNAFTSEDSDRKTTVKIAVIKVTIPNAEFDSSIYNELKKAQYSDSKIDQSMTDVAVNDLVRSIVKQYELEIDAGLQLIREYNGMQKYILSSLKEDQYATPLLELKADGYKCSENRYIQSVRQKYWDALFRDSRFTGNMTNDQQEAYLNQVSNLKHYDFSYCNIKVIQAEMAKTMVKGIEDCIIQLFDECSRKYSWYPECSDNIHYYNGWSTNNSWIINSKIILPISLFKKSIFNNQYEISIWNTSSLRLLYDIEKVFNYLGGHPQTYADCGSTLVYIKEHEVTKNVDFKYFTATFYKKGTCHITFKDLETLKKFNIFGSQRKKWLPPSYGKKQFKDMTPEEQQIVKEFQGEKDYTHVLEHADWYIYRPESSLPQLEELK